jgi:hypothetical protein
MESITESVLRFQDSGSGYKEIENRISVIIYNYPTRVNILTEEDKSEFYLSFYNRIEGLIKNFTYKGVPFETLLNQTLKWHIKTYLTKMKNEKKLMAVNIQEEEIKIRDLLSYSPESKSRLCTEVILKNKASKKRLLFLVLMDSPNISDCELKTFSELTEYEYEWLLYLKDTLNNRLFKRSKRLTMLREKRNNTYMKMLYKQTRYSEESDPDEKKHLLEQLQRLKKRLNDTRYEISRVPSRPTHGEIAELLKVPKGTVDSGLYYFRKRYKSAIDVNSYSLFL